MDFSFSNVDRYLFEDNERLSFTKAAIRASGLDFSFDVKREQKKNKVGGIAVMSIVAVTKKTRLGQVEANQFIVVLPIDPRYDDEAVVERLRVHMGKRFPEYEFRFVTEGLPRSVDQFMVIPICGVVGDGWRKAEDTRLMSPPPFETMGKINRWLKAFDPSVENLVRLN